MRKLHKIILVSLFLTILLAAPLAKADEGSGNVNTRFDHEGNLIIQSGNLTAIFDGEKPSLRFFYTSNAKQVYFVKFNSLTEFNDSDHNLAFERNESLASSTLEASSWTHSNFYNITNPDGVAINFTTKQLMIERVSHMEDDNPDQSHLFNTTVTLVAKLYPSSVDKTITVGNATFTIHGGVEIKMDIFISNWPFISLNDRLALRIDLHSTINDFQVHEQDGEDHQVNETENHTNETETQHTNDTDHEVDDHEGEGQIQLLTSDKLVGGFFRFVSNAITDGTTTPVAGSFRFESDEVNGTEQELKLFLGYHSFNSTLEHDPSFGVNPAAFAPHGVPVFPAWSAAVLGVSAAAVVLARRRRILR